MQRRDSWDGIVSDKHEGDSSDDAPHFFKLGASEKIDIIVPFEDDEDELAKKLANVCQQISDGAEEDLNLVDQILRINNSEDLATVKNRMSKVIKVALKVGADVQKQKYRV